MPTTAPPAGRRAGTGRPARPRVDATLQASLNSCAFPSQAIKPGRGPRTRAGGRPPIHGADVWCARAGHGAGMGAGAGGSTSSSVQSAVQLLALPLGSSRRRKRRGPRRQDWRSRRRKRSEVTESDGEQWGFWSQGDCCPREGLHQDCRPPTVLRGHCSGRLEGSVEHQRFSRGWGRGGGWSQARVWEGPWGQGAGYRRAGAWVPSPCLGSCPLSTK